MKLNKRDLKKQIRLVCGELAGQCIMAAEVAAPEESQKWMNLVIRIANLQYDMVKQCTFAFDKTPKECADRHAYRLQLYAYRKAAYTKLRKDFNTEVSAIVKEMNALLTPEEKEANKAAANL